MNIICRGRCSNTPHLSTLCERY